MNKKIADENAIKEKELLDELRNESITKEIDNYLSRHKIDLKKPAYWICPKYSYCFTKHIDSICATTLPFVTYDYYIEKIILPDRRINNPKTGAYDIGNGKAAPEDISIPQLIHEIIEQIILEIYPQKGKNGEDLYKSTYEKTITNSSKSSLKEHFEDISNIHLSSFNDTYSEYKFLKLLYKFSETEYYGKRINFYLMLQKASSYNLDKTRIYPQNANNGYYISILQNELLKEFPLTQAKYYHSVLNKMVYEWDRIVLYAQNLLFEKEYITLKKLDLYLSHIIEKLPSSQYIKEGNHNASLFSTIYFWLLQHQCLCVRKEMLQVNEYIEINRNDYRTFSIEPYTKISINDIQTYLLKHKDELAKILGLSVFNQRKSMNFFKSCSKRIEIFISTMSEGNYKCIDDDVSYISYSYFISALLALRDAVVNEETASRSQYRAKKSGKLNLISMITAEAEENGFYKLLWIKRISDLEMQLLHFGNAKYKFNIEKSVNKIMSYLFTIYDIDDFEKENAKWLAYADGFFSDVPMK